MVVVVTLGPAAVFFFFFPLTHTHTRINQSIVYYLLLLDDFVVVVFFWHPRLFLLLSCCLLACPRRAYALERRGGVVNDYCTVTHALISLGSLHLITIRTIPLPATS